MPSSKNDVWVGLFVLIGGLALAFLALQSANLLSLSFQPTYQVTARFDNIGGLKPKAAVKSAGVVVGRVEGIDLDPVKFDSIVTLAIDKRFADLSADTSAGIFTSGLLGESYVGLQPGGDPEPLRAGDEIAYTQSAVDLIQLVGKYMFGGAGGSAPPPPPPPTEEVPLP